VAEGITPENQFQFKTNSLPCDVIDQEGTSGTSVVRPGDALEALLASLQKFLN